MRNPPTKPKPKPPRRITDKDVVITTNIRPPTESKLEEAIRTGKIKSLQEFKKQLGW